MERDITIDSHGRKLEGKFYSTNKTNDGIVIAHSYRNSMDEAVCLYAAREFQNAGYSTLRFNFTGHGDSDGGLEDVCFRVISEDFFAAMNLMKENVDGPIGAFAISIGTAGVMLSPVKPEAQILLSPLSRVGGMYRRYMEDINSQIENIERDGYVTLKSASGRGDFRMGREWIEEAKSLNLDIVGRYKVEDTPTFLVQGTQDELIGYRNVLDLAKGNPKLNLLLLNSDHNFSDLQNRTILMKTVISWLNQRMV